MTFRKIAVVTVLSAGLLTAGSASAEVSGSVAVVSDYLFRGVTQTSEKPALQGGVTWTHDSGFYAGGWGSSISWLSDADPDVSSQVELDMFAGYTGKFGQSEFGYDVGLNYYGYPGDYPAGFNDPDTLELYFGLSWKFLSARYWYAIGQSRTVRMLPQLDMTMDVPNQTIGIILVALLVLAPPVWMVVRRAHGLPMTWRAEVRARSRQPNQAPVPPTGVAD